MVYNKYMIKLFLFLLVLIISFSSVEASPDGYLIIEKISLFKPIQFIPDSDLSPETYFYDLTDLHDGVGHLQYTSWGTTEGGRTVLVGHTPGAFEDVYKLEVGDEIIFSMGDEYHTLHVTEKFYTDADDGSVIYLPTESYELVLITCTNDPDTRLILKAK